jgi:hypothetical protein
MTSMQEIISIHGPPHFAHATCGCLLTFCGKFLLVGLVEERGSVRRMACVGGAAKPLSHVKYIPSLDGACSNINLVNPRTFLISTCLLGVSKPRCVVLTQAVHMRHSYVIGSM